MTDAAMDDPAHILVVDDDRRLRDLLKRFLTKQGYRVSAAQNADEAERYLEGLEFDLIVLDVMMPGRSGLDFARELRLVNQVPILMLTAMGETSDRIEGLKSGVDDYLSKPFEPEELVLRLQAILKRAGPASERVEPVRNGAVQFGGHSFDLDHGALSREGARIKLTESEADILRLLAQRAPMPVARSELAARLGINQERSIDVQITRLRRKIETDSRDPVYLKTVRGLGYALMIDLGEEQAS